MKDYTKEIFQAVMDGLNGGTLDPEEFARLMMSEHRTLQQLHFSLIMVLLKEWARCYDENNFDLRNEFTCQKAKQIVRDVEGMACSRAPFI